MLKSNPPAITQLRHMFKGRSRIEVAVRKELNRLTSLVNECAQMSPVQARHVASMLNNRCIPAVLKESGGLHDEELLQLATFINSCR